MDFFSQYYYYLSFFCGCSFLFLSLSCFLLWRAGFGKMSYSWMFLFGITFSVLKFSQMFASGNNLYDLGNYSLPLSITLYASMIFFFMSAQETYLKFKPESKFIEYLILPLSLVCMITGFCFGLKLFNAAIFIFMWLPSSVMVAVSVYNLSKTDLYAKKNILAVFILFIIYCIVYFASEAGVIIGLSMKFQSVCEACLACIVFFIGAQVFKYFKVSHEKHVRIYDYIPVYWRHIPIGTILFIVLVGGLFFAMYLENYSRENIEKNSKAVVETIAETVSTKLNKSDQISKALSRTPFIRESMSDPDGSDGVSVNRMLEDYCRIFKISMIFTANNEGDIEAYSNLVYDFDLLNINIKYRPYFTSAQNNVHGSIFANSLIGIKQSYFASEPIMHTDDGTIAGVLVIRDDVEDIVSKLQQYKNIYVIDENGVIFLSDAYDINFSYLWQLYGGNENSKKSSAGNMLPGEIFDGDTVVLNNESYYVARQFIGEKGWSVVYFSSLNPIKQFKVLSIAGVSGALIIILLLFWSINQSNRILALALQHKAILNSAKSIMIVATDVQGKIIVYGQGMEDILGYTLEEFRDKGLNKIMFDKEGNAITFEEAVTYSSSASTEFLCRRKDGTMITILVSVLPQYSLGNKLIGYIFSGADITATKEVERELEQQIKFLQMLIDSMPIAVYYKDSEMHLIGCNKAFEDIMENSKDFMIGKKAVYFDRKADMESQRTDKIVAASLSSITYEMLVKFRKSPPRNLVYYKSSYKKIDGRFGGVIGVILNVTQERKMQEERNVLQTNLIQQNKLASLGELAGSIAHELNNPLSVILGFAQVLIKNTSLDEEARKGIENIYEAAKRSKGVITNMLEFARSDTSKSQMVQINDIIDATLLIVEKDLHKANIEVEKNLAADAHPVIANPMQIQQVLLNMLLNAKDSMPDGGKVAIHTDTNDKYFIINISDTGSGIPKDIISKIFDPFFTTKSAGKGTGLGLSICYGIVKAHKGDISVKSEVNKGTLFKIRFPMMQK